MGVRGCSPLVWFDQEVAVIEVVFAGGEGRAFAPDAESAVVAARTMWDDVRLTARNPQVGPGGLRRAAALTVEFFVDGNLVRTITDRKELG
jgi:hypothetical protein